MVRRVDVSTPPQAPSGPGPADQLNTVVRQGENFAQVAQRNQVSQEDLRKANPGVNPNRIQTGLELHLPHHAEGKVPAQESNSLAAQGASEPDLNARTSQLAEHTLSGQARAVQLQDGLRTAGSAAGHFISPAQSAGPARPHSIAGDLPVPDLGALGRSFFEDVNRAADHLGGALRGAGETLQQAGQALEGRLPIAQDVQALGREASSAGQAIADAPELAATSARALAGQANGLANSAAALVAQAGAQVAQLGGPVHREVQRGIEHLEHGAQQLRVGAQQYVTEVATTAARETDVRQMAPGDTMNLTLEGEGSVEGAAARTRSHVEISRARTGGTFDVGIEGEARGGLHLQLGERAGVNADVEGNAMLGAGGRMEMRFDNAGQTQQALALIARAGTSPGHGQLTPEEAGFLTKHISALEFRGIGSADAQADLGTERLGIPGLGLGSSASLEHEGTFAARVEFEGGRASQLVVRSRMTSHLEGGMSIGLGHTSGHGGEVSADHDLGVSGGQLTFEATDRFHLPPMSVEEFERNPRAALASSAPQIVRDTQSECRLGVEVEGGVGQTRSRVGAEITWHGQPGAFLMSGGLDLARRGDVNGAVRALGPGTNIETRLTENAVVGQGLNSGVDTSIGFAMSAEDLANSGALNRTRTGDLGGALRAVHEHTQVTVESTPFREAGFSFNPEVQVMGFGGSLGIDASNRHVGSTSHREMSAADAVDLFAGAGREPRPPD
jgi:LysM repeat protein